MIRTRRSIVFALLAGLAAAPSIATGAAAQDAVEVDRTPDAGAATGAETAPPGTAEPAPVPDAASAERREEAAERASHPEPEDHDPLRPAGYDPKRAGHPVRIVAYALHPVGVAIDYLVLRPAYWVGSHEPFRTIFGVQR